MFRLKYSLWLLLPALVLVLGGVGPVAAADEDAHAALIDKPAPDLKGDFALNGKPTSLSDLKGKVVMLDFWAVWCGPCVSTFPHLIEWNKEYKDKGLEIVGITSYYQQVGFDKEAGKITRVKEKLTPKQEQEMLKDFVGHHKLTHLIMTLSPDDDDKVSKDYKIRFIPQVVLIDKKGNVRQVVVGSGEEKAKQVEETIKKLLAE